jgi:hypothetical protein
VAFIGLYYLKFILETTRSIALCPSGMIGHTGDSPTVKLFKDELEFIDSISSRSVVVV